MKKSSALLLPLIAILASCSGRIVDPVKDGVFADARKQYNPKQSVKDEVNDTFNVYQSIVKYAFEVKDYEWDGTAFVYASTQTKTHFYRTTVNTNHSNPVKVLIEHEENPYYVESQLVQVTSIKKVGEGYQYDLGPLPAFITDAAKAYEILRDAMYSWKASFFSAASYYLLNSNGTENNMPIEALESFRPEFVLSENPEYGDGSFTIATIPADMEYYKDDKTFVVKGFEAIYKKYLLRSFTGTALVTSYSADFNHMYETTVSISTNQTVNYAKV